MPRDAKADFWKALAENSLDILTVVARDGTILYHSPSIERILGYPRRERIGQSILSFVHPDDRARVRRLLAAGSAVEGAVRFFALRVRRKNGGYRTLQVAARNLLDDPAVGGIVVSSRDVTAASRGRRRLAESEALFRGLVELSPYGIFIHRDGRILFANAAGARIHGAAGPADLVGRHVLDFTHPDSLPAVRRRLRLLSESRPPGLEEVRIRRLDGTTATVEIVATPVVFAGRPAAQTIMTDTGERRKMEEERGRAEILYRTVFNQSPDGIMVLDPETTLPLEMNDVVCRHLECSREEALGLRLEDYVCDPPPERIREVVRRMVGEGGACVEATVRTRGGNRREFEIRTRTVELAGRKLLHVVSRDITEARRHREEIAAYQQRLKDTASDLLLSEEHQRRRIAADLHDRVGHNLALARMRVEKLRSLRMGGESAAIAAEIEEMLRAAVEYTRSLTAELSPPVLHLLGLGAAIEWLADRFSGNGPAFHVAGGDGGAGLPEKPRTILFLAVQELFMNAVKHARARNVWVASGRADGTFSITVKDDGTGFDAEGVISHRSPGGGIGLFSLRERVSGLGGTVAVESAPGRGSAVTIVVPLAGTTAQETAP